jgi:hypothetical protein
VERYRKSSFFRRIWDSRSSLRIRRRGEGYDSPRQRWRWFLGTKVQVVGVFDGVSDQTVDNGGGGYGWGGG